MRSLILLAAVLAAPLPAVAAAVDAAPAAQADVSAAFGNTLLTIDPDGRTRKLWLNPDHSWTGLSRRGLALAGTWRVKGDKVCLKQSKPRLPGSLCHVMPPGPGAAVVAKDPSGQGVRLKLVKGRVRG